MAELANIQETRLYFGGNDANACEAQEGKSASSIYSHLSCVAVAHSAVAVLERNVWGGH